MDIQDLMKNIKTLTSSQIEQKLESLIHNNYHFSNLSEKNKDVVLDLIKDYKDLIRQGIHITSTKISHDMHHLYEKRLSLDLSSEDLADIKKILEAFKA